MEAKREPVAALLNVGLKHRQICEVTVVSMRFVEKVRTIVTAGGLFKRKPGSGQRPGIRTEDFLCGLANEIEADPTKLMQKLALDLEVNEKTIRNALKDLGLKSYVRWRRQLLTAKSKASRGERGRKILNFLKSKSPSTVLVFSNKKNCTVDQARNARNDRYLTNAVDNVPPINQKKHSASAMMLGGVASDGSRMPPYWFEKGMRVGAMAYLEVMKKVVKP